MKATRCAILVLLGLVGLGLAGVAMANTAVDGDEPAMMASPSLIVLAKVGTITIHTNIVAASVVSGSIDLDGAAPLSVGVDSCGHLVAKFAVADLGLEPGEAILTLCGDFKDGSSFSAADVVGVK